MIEAAKAGGAELRRCFGTALEVTEKTMAADVVSNADIASEKAILAVLDRTHPDINILSEECGRIDRGSRFTFVIDPLDGTNNFVMGLPNFLVSIALLEEETKQVQVAVIFVPLLDRVYSAEKGKGAFCNDERLHVSAASAMRDATISVISGYAIAKATLGARLATVLTKEPKRVMQNWCAYDYCLFASGKTEGVISDDTALHDIVCPMLFAREAGAIITDFLGNPVNDDTSPSVVMSNTPDIHRVLLDVVRKT